jgi:hypothetical protein
VTDSRTRGSSVVVVSKRSHEWRWAFCDIDKFNRGNLVRLAPIELRWLLFTPPPTMSLLDNARYLALSPQVMSVAGNPRLILCYHTNYDKQTPSLRVVAVHRHPVVPTTSALAPTHPVTHSVRPLANIPLSSLTNPQTPDFPANLLRHGGSGECRVSTT